VKNKGLKTQKEIYCWKSDYCEFNLIKDEGRHAFSHLGTYHGFGGLECLIVLNNTK